MKGEVIGDREANQKRKAPSYHGIFEGVEKDPIGDIGSEKKCVVVKLKSWINRPFISAPKADDDDHNDRCDKEDKQHQRQWRRQKPTYD